MLSGQLRSVLSSSNLRAWLENITHVASQSEFNATTKYWVNSIKQASRQSVIILNKSQFFSPHESNSTNVKYNCKFYP